MTKYPDGTRDCYLCDKLIHPDDEVAENELDAHLACWNEYLAMQGADADG